MKNYVPKPGDRVLIPAVVSLPATSEGNVQIRLCNGGTTSVSVGEIESVTCAVIEAGDRVSWWGTVNAVARQGAYCAGTVLYVEPAESAAARKDADPALARALVKPDGSLARPMFLIADLERIAAATEETPHG